MTNPDSIPEQQQPPSSGPAHVQPQPFPDYQQAQQPLELNQPAPQHRAQPSSPPPFQPLFTLVTDSSGATHHPHIHYIFEDDDPDLLTHILGHHSAQQQQQQSDAASSGSKSTTPVLPNDRAIILDLVPKLAPNHASDAAPDAAHGYEVAWASSLSTDWAVVSAALAPMTGAAAAAAAAANASAATPPPPASSSSSTERLMLRIEGVDLGRPAQGGSARDLSSGGSSSSAAAAAAQQDDFNDLVDEFDARMAVLRRVVDAGAERQANMAAGAQHSPRCEPPVAGVFENLLSGHGVSPAAASHEQQLDVGGAQSGSGRVSGISSGRASDGSGSGAQPGQSKRASGGSGEAERAPQPGA